MRPEDRGEKRQNKQDPTRQMRKDSGQKENATPRCPQRLKDSEWSSPSSGGGNERTCKQGSEGIVSCSSRLWPGTLGRFSGWRIRRRPYLAFQGPGHCKFGPDICTSAQSPHKSTPIHTPLASARLISSNVSAGGIEAGAVRSCRSC